MVFEHTHPCIGRLGMMDVVDLAPMLTFEDHSSLLLGDRHACWDLFRLAHVS